MSASLILVRTKPTAVPDPDPSLGVFVPPEGEVFKVSALAAGFRFGLNYTTGVTFSCVARIYLRDQATGFWYLGGVQGVVSQRRLFVQDDSGAHDVWIRLTAIPGGAPIQIFMEEVPAGRQ